MSGIMLKNSKKFIMWIEVFNKYKLKKENNNVISFSF